MSLLNNIVSAFFVGVTHVLIQNLGFILSAWSLSLSLFVCVVIANIYFYRFPCLNFMVFRNVARQIIKNFPNAGIRKIFLRKYDSPYSKQLGGNVPTKYHLIMLLDSPLSEEGKKLQMAAINFHGVDGTNLQGIGLNNNFFEVYKQKPTDDYLKEWVFIVTDDYKKFKLTGHFDKGWSAYIRNFT